MRKSRFSRLTALVLALVLALSLTVTAFAQQTETAIPVTLTETDVSGLADAVLKDGTEAESEAEALYADDEEVRVIIVFDKDSVIEKGFSTTGLADNKAAVAYSDSLEKDQDKVIDAIEAQALSGGQLDVRYRFTVSINAVSATVEYGRIEEILAVDGVTQVYLDEEVYELQDADDPDTATSGQMVGSYSAWADGYTGAGTRVAIIDTGIDIDHPSFDQDAFLYGLAISAASFGKTIEDYDLLTMEDIDKVLDKLSIAEPDENGVPTVSAEDLYISAKLPFGYDYLMKETDAGYDDLSGDHGVHVAGIAAANKYVPNVDSDGDAIYTTQANGVVGIAPDAQILVMKVFSDGFGAYADNYMAAIEDALWLDCDTINMSLGSSMAGTSFISSSVYAEVYANLLNSDTVLTNSGGNNGTWAENSYSPAGLNLTGDMRTATGGSPGSYTDSFTVASVDNIAITGIMGTYNGVNSVPTDTSESYNARGFASLDTSEDKSGTDYEYVFLGDPETGRGIYGNEADFNGLDLSGKVVLISRGGGVSFFEKANRAVAHGAVATVVYNNVDGTINMNLTGYEYTAPAVCISKADGDNILAASVKDENTGIWGGTVTVVGKPRTQEGVPEGFKPSSFSSWGTTENLGLKPEITAAGGNIYSTLGGGSYGLMSGTSMSAPSVTGVAAVTAQYIKENGLAEKTGLSVRALSIALLMGTSRPLTDETTGLPYSPRQQGSGFVQVYEAVTSPAYLLVGETEGNDGKVKFEFGDDPDRSGVYSGTFTINNLTDEPLTYDFDSIITTMAVEEYEGVEYMSTSTYALSPDVSFAPEYARDYSYDLNGDGAVNEMDAMVLLKVANGTLEPLSAEDSAKYDLDADGVISSTDAQLFLAALTGDTANIDVTDGCYTVPAGGSMEVAVTITLSQSDRDYLDAHYENGCYVEGFLYLNSVSGDGKQQSIPLLAYYGNWTEPSMYDPYVLLEDYYDEDAFSYVTDGGPGCYLTRKFSGNSSAYYFMPNLYADDGECLTDRNAIASGKGDTLYSVNPSMIRNARNLSVEISNAETGEVYFTKNYGGASGAYYYSNTSSWSATSTNVSLSWAVIDGDRRPIAEDTVLNVTVRAVPEYYWNAAADVDNGESPITGELADGAYWTTTMTVDNTAPQITGAALSNDVVTGERRLTVKAVDNRYVASVQVWTPDLGMRLLNQSPNQTEKNTECSVEFDLEGIYSNTLAVIVLDYAGNMSGYIADFGDVEVPAPANYVYAAIPDGQGQWFTMLDMENGTLSTLNETAGSIPVLSAALGKDGVLYAASMETDADKHLLSRLYAVDTETWEMTLVGPEGTPTETYTDMSYLPTLNGGRLIASYGSMVLILNGETGVYEKYANFSSYGTIIGLTYVGSDQMDGYDSVDMFAFLTSSGTIYLSGFAYNSSNGNYTYFTPSALGYASGTNEKYSYGSSLYYDGERFFASIFDGSVSRLMYLDVDAEYKWMVPVGSLSTAPVCIFGSAKKTAEDGAITAELLGEPVELETESAADIPQLQAADEITNAAAAADIR